MHKHVGQAEGAAYAGILRSGAPRWRRSGIDANEGPVKALGVLEAAQWAGVSPDTVRRRLRAGAFPNAARTGAGGAWMIPIADLVEAAIAPAGGVPTVSAMTSRHDTTPDAELDGLRALVAAQAEHIADLRRQVEDLRTMLASGQRA